MDGILSRLTILALRLIFLVANHEKWSLLTFI